MSIEALFRGKCFGTWATTKIENPYAVSVFQGKENARVGGPFPITKKPKYISFDSANLELERNVN